MKLFSALVALLLSLATATPSALAQVREATVTAQGTGLTREDAVQAALLNAAGQAFGVNLRATTESIQVASETTVNNDTESLLISALNRNIQQTLRTPDNSPILGYTVEYAAALPTAGWEATVTLRHAQYERLGADSNRRSMVVIGNSRQYSTMLRETVSESLIASRRFDILSRSNNALFDAEKQFILGSDAATAEVARLGQASGADYLVIAELASLGINNNQRETIRMTGEVLVESSVSGTLRLQVLEFASRKVKWSGTQAFSGKYPGATQVGAANLARLVTQASNKLIDKMVASIYPIRIIKVMGDTAVINRGEGAVSAGQTYAVFLEGEELIDPQSGESLGSMEMEVGTGRITDVKPKFAMLKMTTGQLDGTSSYIVRQSSKPAPAPPRPPARSNASRSTPAEPSRKDAFLNN